MSALFAFFTRSRNNTPTAATTIATSNDETLTQPERESSTKAPVDVGGGVCDFEPVPPLEVESTTVAEADEVPPTSPTSEALRVAPDPLDTKATRAHEVARQRAKHAGDRRKTRAQKVPKAARGHRGAGSVEGDKDADEVLPVPKVKVTKAKNAKDVAAVGEEEIPHIVSVRLEDLIRDAKVRKEKGTALSSSIVAFKLC